MDVGVNVAPVFSNASSLQVTKGKEYSLEISISDLNQDDVLSVTAEGLPDWLGFNQIHCTGTPTGSDLGSSSFTLEASDGSLSTEQTFYMIVTIPWDQSIVFSRSIFRSHF